MEGPNHNEADDHLDDIRSTFRYLLSPRVGEGPEGASHSTPQYTANTTTVGDVLVTTPLRDTLTAILLSHAGVRMNTRSRCERIIHGLSLETAHGIIGALVMANPEDDNAACVSEEILTFVTILLAKALCRNAEEKSAPQEAYNLFLGVLNKATAANTTAHRGGNLTKPHSLAPLLARVFGVGLPSTTSTPAAAVVTPPHRNVESSALNGKKSSRSGGAGKRSRSDDENNSVVDEPHMGAIAAFHASTSPCDRALAMMTLLGDDNYQRFQQQFDYSEMTNTDMWWLILKSPYWIEYEFLDPSTKIDTNSFPADFRSEEDGTIVHEIGGIVRYGVSDESDPEIFERRFRAFITTLTRFTRAHITSGKHSVVDGCRQLGASPREDPQQHQQTCTLVDPITTTVPSSLHEAATQYITKFLDHTNEDGRSALFEVNGYIKYCDVENYNGAIYEALVDNGASPPIRELYAIADGTLEFIPSNKALGTVAAIIQLDPTLLNYNHPQHGTILAHAVRCRGCSGYLVEDLVKRGAHLGVPAGLLSHDGAVGEEETSNASFYQSLPSAAGVDISDSSTTISPALQGLSPLLWAAHKWDNFSDSVVRSNTVRDIAVQLADACDALNTIYPVALSVIRKETFELTSLTTADEYRNATLDQRMCALLLSRLLEQLDEELLMKLLALGVNPKVLIPASHRLKRPLGLHVRTLLHLAFVIEEHATELIENQTAEVTTLMLAAFDVNMHVRDDSIYFSLDFISFLIDMGVPLTQLDTGGGCTPLQDLPLAYLFQNDIFHNVLRALLAAGADPNAGHNPTGDDDESDDEDPGYWGYPLNHMISLGKSSSDVLLMLDAGAHVDSQDPLDCITPLQELVQLLSRNNFWLGSLDDEKEDVPRIARALLEQGASINVCPFRETLDRDEAETEIIALKSNPTLDNDIPETSIIGKYHLTSIPTGWETLSYPIYAALLQALCDAGAELPDGKCEEWYLSRITAEMLSDSDDDYDDEEFDDDNEEDGSDEEDHDVDDDEDDDDDLNGDYD